MNDAPANHGLSHYPTPNSNHKYRAKSINLWAEQCSEEQGGSLLPFRATCHSTTAWDPSRSLEGRKNPCLALAPPSTALLE